jgi:hypothetical protein
MQPWGSFSQHSDFSIQLIVEIGFKVPQQFAQKERLDVNVMFIVFAHEKILNIKFFSFCFLISIIVFFLFKDAIGQALLSLFC